MVLTALIALVAVGSLISIIPSESQNSPQVENASQGQCESVDGVSLVIDFGTSSNREVAELCASDFNSTGWALFSAAGVKVEGTSEYPTGFVCRLDNWPTAQDQPCTKTPTAAQGSWVYFVAEPGSSTWQYSGQGAAMRSPSCGAADGWRFVEAGEVISQTAPRVQPATKSCR
jgi:hypothetical protein